MDQSLKFGNVSYDDYSVYIAQGELMSLFLDLLMLNCEKFNIESMIKNWTDKVIGHQEIICELDCQFEDNQCESFNVHDYADNLKKMTPFTKPSSIYFTKSHLDFSADGKRHNFYLVRMKKSYKLKTSNNCESVGVNSELLDISCTTPFSYTHNNYNYQPINLL